MSKEAEMSIAVSAMFPGFRFSPTDVELISYYLRRKIDGDEDSVAVIAEVEIYKFEPWDLPEESKLKSENEWFYFCARGRKYPHGSQSRRATKLGYWKATGKERTVKSGNQVVGTKRTLVFHIGRAPRGERTEWIMHEYCIHGAPQDALVVCRLRKNADFRASSSQKKMEDGVVQDDGYVGQSGGTEKKEKSNSVYDQLPNGDIAESSNVVEEQADTDDDCYAEILNDDIIKLDEEALKASQAFRPTNPTHQETISSESSTYGFTDETDRQALFDFKSQVSEDKRVVLSSWNNSFPLCNWNGVTCGHKHKRVTRLDLGGLQLGGVISPSIGNLSFLISLNLTKNSFVGTIPHEVGNLFRLQHLNMSFNFLEGEIPASLSNCSRLLNLGLYSNHLEGSVHSELGSLTKLVGLYLGQNNLKGKIPSSLGNLTSLIFLGLANNNIEGGIPEGIARLTQIVDLELSMNNFSGVFPPAIYNLSSLEYLSISANSFCGSLRPEFGNLLPKIRTLYLEGNHFTGAIPETLSNISNLQVVAMEYNNLMGSIPLSFGKVRNLQLLELYGNFLGSYSSGDLEFLGSLTNCTHLQTLSVGENRLGGDLPTSIANLSTNLIHLSLGKNHISGSIPHDIGNLISLQTFQLEKNMLVGPLPTSLGKLSNLGILSLYSNRMSGEIPSSLGNITRLEKLYLSNNSFDGIIPPSLGNCGYLLRLYMGSNKLNGTIPREIMQIKTLVNLGLSDNSLTGSLPNGVGGLELLVTLTVAHNKLSGKLPQTLGKCLSLEKLYLQGNSFDGDIPDIRGLVGIQRVDLSNNNFSGSIPEYLGNISSLEYLNLSFNNFEGRVSTEGKFQNATIVSVLGNKHLCGASVSLCWFRKRKKNENSTNPTPSTLEVFHEKISYGDLRNATNGFSSSNLIGSGSFGTVFKASLHAENNVVAVKVLNLQRHGAMKSFLAECESLKSIRHRNLVKLLTACSSIDFQGKDFRALIYEFMPNGSLDMWLHQDEVEELRRPSRNLTLLERLNVAIDVASVLDYLHVHCHEPIVHCDLKPSNVLLDGDLTAHVSDFGMAQLLLKFDKESFLNQLSSAGVRGTIGYAAPEYGMGGQPSIHGDVYSFGVLLLEMFTGKRPTNLLFGGNLTIHSYTRSALPVRVLEIVDKSIIRSGLRIGFPVTECLTLLLEVGLRCCEESPTKRLTTSEITKELFSIRERFFKARRTARH
ncbi:Leucine-rich repeat [Arabidopsis thaliana x Arabidopsis arenosa]|uniref:non-specific serine/threonine protein kinase n=1 Tax=Arabidopsis thaliana x Arabidopsis arenosa TaxID=1240361 RepID=A0A8T2A4X2_9BRAS|nr:Leucine-rich repeat [Arabidopsis thaliana x Arabidopsis arenosa]